MLRCGSTGYGWIRGCRCGGQGLVGIGVIEVQGWEGMGVGGGPGVGKRWWWSRMGGYASGGDPESWMDEYVWDGGVHG